MKKIVLVFGLIAGLIVTGMMVYGTLQMKNNEHFQDSMVLGYTTMVVAFSLIFVGVKNFRDKHNNGVISFGKAFRIGLYITLIASTMYVGAWLIEYYFFFPDFTEKYTACVIKDAKKSGATQVELNAKMAEMAQMQEMYKNPLFVVLFTYLEIFPVGLIITLICAFLLKKKRKPEDQFLAS
ncbi:MAG: DUF4199 domain-containing protein [Niastella sp.]|nr:DUF4199 domain-containing protein [Niastella sp.]